MAKSSKLTIFIFSLLLVLSSILFGACGKKKFADTYISTSQEYVEIFAGKEAEVSVTINNPEHGMNNGIICSISNPNIATVERLASQNFTTTFKITGKNGGATNLEFASAEGGKKTEITVYVKKFSDTLESETNNLFVSQKKTLTPTASDFKFNDNATERNLNFYFYGLIEDGELTVEDLQEENIFTEIQLKEINNSNYLIFKNKDGLFYTLGIEQSVLNSNNKKYNLVEVNQNEGEFVIDAARSTAVNPGQKFTFIAKYLKEKEEDDEKDIICKRDFTVLLDIDKDAISHEYGYKILNELNTEIPYQKGVENTSYKIDDYKKGDIILIPNYITPITDNMMLAGCSAKYLTAYLEVTLATNADLLIDAKSRNVNVSSAMSLGRLQSNGKTTYYFEISCSLGETDTTYFDINFYYDGFKDSADDSVSYTYSIPVIIREIPTQLLINDADFNAVSRVFKFYNSYADDDVGWYPFNFSVLPEGSNFTKLIMDLTDSGLQARYMNKIYTEEVEINNLKETVYLKGIDNTEATSDVKEIPVRLEFNVIKPDAYETTIKYEIVKGASKLDFETQEFKDNIYLQYEGGAKSFVNIYADAEFENVTTSLESGVDVINIGYNDGNVCKYQNNLYYLNLNLIPKNIGSGTYRVSIDNGRAVLLNVTVNENLTKVNVYSNNENNTLRLFEPIGINSSIAYLYNMEGNSYFDIQLYANDNLNSNAIRSVSVSLNSSTLSWEQDQEITNKFKIYSKANGSTQITFTVTGYSINAFVIEDVSIKYIINLVTFDYIEQFEIYKLTDGYSQIKDDPNYKEYAPKTMASYVDVYTNTYSQALREAKFEVGHGEGYLFENPSKNIFEDENYSNEYLYFESEIQTYQNGKSVNKIFYDPNNAQNNIYTIGNYGTFDAEKLTFTAFQALQMEGKIRLFAHVRQYNKLYSFSISITIHTYEEVSRISLQTMEDKITFSVFDTEKGDNKEPKSIIAFPTNSTATNPIIVAIPSEVTAGEKKFNAFDVPANSIITPELVSGGKSKITFKLNEDFIKAASTEEKNISGTISIVALDWLDDAGNIRSEYRNKVITLNFEYENGTKGNRLTIRNADDLLAIKKNLSAHYKINTNIDVAAISNKFPLGELKGSIVGVNEYAQLSNIIISHGVDEGETNLFGVFSSIAEGAFIEYVQFSGSFNIGSEEDAVGFARIGMVAGQNNGKLINVGVTINRSNVYIKNVSEFGGVVGVNNGEIIQDFTLFEDDSSQTKTKIATDSGRISYYNKNLKITVMMNDFVNVYYISEENYPICIGGVIGQNNGTLQKIDSTVLKFSGYNNYMVYSKLKTQYISSQFYNNVYVGALIGDSSGLTQKVKPKVIAGYNTSSGFTTYSNPSDFTAGKGMIVGGEVWGYGYVGGAIGKFYEIDSSASFTGLTVRTFVRGQQANETQATLAIIANIDSDASLSQTFAIQAVDDGRINEESSMAVLYSSSADTSYFNNSDIIINKLGFGPESNSGLGVLIAKATKTSEVNVYSYVKRTPLKGENIIVNNSSKDVYYGDFVIIGINNSNKTILKQANFELGNEKDLSVSPKFNNQLVSSDEKGIQKVFYAYYYQVASSPTNDIADLQKEVDNNLNRVTMLSSLYPFVVKGELTFTSLTPSILTIDPTGTITFKRTGLAKISATSVLNTNSNSTIFYIYVINYFNTQSLIAVNNQRSSIIYPTLAGNAVPFNDTVIELRGNNNYTVYVRPDYTFEEPSEENGNFNADKYGTASIKGVVFNLAANNVVTAKVEIDKEKTAKINSGVASVNDNELSITIIDQTITFRRTNATREMVYALNIEPILKVNLGNGDEDYIASVNKALGDSSLDYKYGAISLNNINYNTVPIQTSRTINDELEIISTDPEEDIPFYKISGLEGEDLQGNIEGLVYAASDNLFNVKITRLTGKLTTSDLINGSYIITYKMVISVNTNSSIYINRYSKNIYGRYYLYLQSSSNSDVTLTIPIDFEKTNVTTVVIDNYTSLNEINDKKSLGASSVYAYPGESGMLEITINPEDSDFDYIVIENDSQNYETGKASAQFSLLARYANNDENMFNDGVVLGQQLGSGFRITLNELVEAYNKKGEDNKNIYNPYNGIIYIRYDMSSHNVSDLSISRVNILIYKEGAVVHTASIDLTVKIQNFVAVGIEGKDGTMEGNYYRVYNVARGLKYKLTLDSYGFNRENITLISSNPQLGQISNENGTYYLTITGNAISYLAKGNQFEIITTASQTEGGIVRNAESKTKISIQEFVFNYNGESVKNPDIVKGMSQGVINIQVGSFYDLEIDVYDYLEYDSSNQSVVNKIEEFINELETKGIWRVHTNLIASDQPNFNQAPDVIETDSPYRALSPNIGYTTQGTGSSSTSIKNSGENYYLNYDGLRIQPKKTHLPEEKFYFIKYNVDFTFENGTYNVKTNGTDGATSNKISTIIILNVYSTSSEESPIPIYDYDDFNNMMAGGYYILLNDINLPNAYDAENGEEQFMPIAGNFASFDGNGHSINFSGVYNMGNLSSIGIFSSIEDETTVKNLIVNFMPSAQGDDLETQPNDIYELNGLRTVKFITTSDSFNFGSITAENYGMITNCSVFTSGSGVNGYYLTIKADNALNGSSYVGGLVGTNIGYITNCSVSINAKVPFNLAGVVARNNKKVAACYFKEGILINNSQYNQHVSGFTITNANQAQIITSYVAGAQSSESLYSLDTNSYIISPLSGAGFVYQNEGLIKDCYSDIDLSKSGSMSGFCYANSSIIRNCFSLSILRSRTTASAGFVRDNFIEGVYGEFENCFYLSEKQSENSLDAANKLNDDINVDLYNVNYDGVKKLNRKNFEEIGNYFEDFSYDDAISTNAVWFYSQGRNNGDYVDFIPTTERVVIQTDDENVKQGSSQSNTVFNTQLITFAKNRLELVAPNVKALSIRNFSYSEVDEGTGNITYFYLDDASTPNRGTKHNPRLIYNYSSMESEILNETASNGINTSAYRIISDISYIEAESYSMLYKVIFAGSLEGNGMDIQAISLASMDEMTNGGLFAQIGSTANREGVVKNLTILPREVKYNNAVNVGTLAGTLKFGYVYDITVDGEQYNLTAISGLNFVGGIIGRAVSRFEIKDIYSDSNIWSVYSPREPVRYVENSGNEPYYSYAGGLIGYVGSGTVKNAHINTLTSVSGAMAGLAYGGIGSGGKVYKTYADVNNGLQIKAKYYGGLIVGEQSGELRYSHVSDNGNIESVFTSVPRAAVAVGGIAGVFSGGIISDSVMEQSFRVVNSENENPIKNVGGLVGQVNATNSISTIDKSIVDADIIGSTILGGAVGLVSSSLVAHEIAVKSSLLSVVGNNTNPCLGGIVGSVSYDDHSAVDISQSYCWADLSLDSNVAGLETSASVGGLIGSAPSSASIKLAYCYTTSSITAKVYDTRAVGSVGDFAIKKGDAKENLEYNYNITTSESNGNTDINEVYYYGHSENNAVDDELINLYNNSLKSYASFETKVKSHKITLNVNNFGMSSWAYAEKREKSLFNNLYGNKYQIFDIGNLPVGWEDKKGPSGENKDNTGVYDLDCFYDSATRQYYYTKRENVDGKDISSKFTYFIDDNGKEKYKYTEILGNDGETIDASKLKYSDYRIEEGANKFFDISQTLPSSITRKYSLINHAEKKTTDYDVVYKHLFSEGTTETKQFYDEDDKSFTSSIALNKDKKDEFIMEETFEASSLVKITIFRDAEGNYYKSILKVELGLDSHTDNKQKTFYFYKVKLAEGEKASDAIKTAKYQSFVDNNIYSNLGSVTQVWVTDGEFLSTLSFEDNLNWLNKM